MAAFVVYWREKKMNSEPAQLAVPRSSFVTVLAWIFIAFAGFGTFISLLQNIMINTVFPLDQMRSAMSQAHSDQNMPAFAAFMFNNIRLFFAAFLIVSVSTLIAAIALLKRKNWARVLFIAILALGIVWNLGGLVVQQFFFASMSSIPPNTPPEFRANFEAMGTMMTVMKIFSAVMAVGFSVLFAWIIKRLASVAIRQEFV
jgi:hypothetical protein